MRDEQSYEFVHPLIFCVNLALSLDHYKSAWKEALWTLETSIHLQHVVKKLISMNDVT